MDLGIPMGCKLPPPPHYHHLSLLDMVGCALLAEAGVRSRQVKRVALLWFDRIHCLRHLSDFKLTRRLRLLSPCASPCPSALASANWAASLSHSQCQRVGGIGTLFAFWMCPEPARRRPRLRLRPMRIDILNASITFGLAFADGIDLNIFRIPQGGRGVGKQGEVALSGRGVQETCSCGKAVNWSRLYKRTRRAALWLTCVTLSHLSDERGGAAGGSPNLECVRCLIGPGTLLPGIEMLCVRVCVCVGGGKEGIKAFIQVRVGLDKRPHSNAHQMITQLSGDHSAHPFGNILAQIPHWQHIHACDLWQPAHTGNVLPTNRRYVSYPATRSQAAHSFHNWMTLSQAPWQPRFVCAPNQPQPHHASISPPTRPVAPHKRVSFLQCVWKQIEFARC